MKKIIILFAIVMVAISCSSERYKNIYASRPLFLVDNIETGERIIRNTETDSSVPVDTFYVIPMREYVWVTYEGIEALYNVNLDKIIGGEESEKRRKQHIEKVWVFRDSNHHLSFITQHRSHYDGKAFYCMRNSQGKPYLPDISEELVNYYIKKSSSPDPNFPCYRELPEGFDRKYVPRNVWHTYLGFVDATKKYDADYYIYENKKNK